MSQFIFVVSESWVTTTVKIWSKSTLSKISKVFLFWVKGKTENLETEILFFSAKNISWSLSFCLSQFFLSFFQLSYNLHVQVTAKIWSKGTLSKISEFSILYIGQNQKLENLQNFDSINVKRDSINKTFFHFSIAVATAPFLVICLSFGNTLRNTNSFQYRFLMFLCTLATLQL